MKIKTRIVSQAAAFFAITFLSFFSVTGAQEQNDLRDQWLDYMGRVAQPVMSALADDKLRMI